MPDKTVILKNANLNNMKSDYLYHLGINVANTQDTSDIQKQFGDVKFICMGGTVSRMCILAKKFRTLFEPQKAKTELKDLCESTGRYAVFKIGPILCCSHGLGMTPFSVLLHELLKLVKYAKCQDPIFIRLGTCGGLGVRPGTVVISKHAYNGYLKNEHEIAILGERVRRPAMFHEGLINKLLECSAPDDDFDILCANTMGTECFYEGQGRLDGAVCDYTVDDKLHFLRKCYDIGIRNIEMEAPMFAALTHHVGVKAADVCVTLINRLEGDQVKISMEQKHEFEERPLIVVTRFILKTLNSK